MATEPLYTTPEAGQFLGVSERTAQRWVRSGRLVPDRKIGGLDVFTAAELRRVAALPKPRRGPARRPPQAGEGLFARPTHAEAS